MDRDEYLFEKFAEVDEAKRVARMVLTRHVPGRDDIPAPTKDDHFYTYEQLEARQAALANVDPAHVQPSYLAEVRETGIALEAMRPFAPRRHDIRLES